jgi:hypothetical protein
MQLCTVFLVITSAEQVISQTKAGSLKRSVSVKFQEPVGSFHSSQSRFASLKRLSSAKSTNSQNLRKSNSAKDDSLSGSSNAIKGALSRSSSSGSLK